MERLILKPINRKNYKVKIVGSDKVYYNKYPYKVRLKDNSIHYDMDESAAIVRYVNDDFNKKKMKIVFNYTRHVYFKTLDMFQEFMYVFEDAVDLVMGPISKKHCEALKKVNNTNKWGLELYHIRPALFFDKFDTKIVWDFPHTAEIYGASNISYPAQQPFMGRRRWNDYFKDLGDNVMSVADSKTNNRLTYLNKSDIEDLQFFMKLQKGDVIKNIVHVIVIENL